MFSTISRYLQTLGNRRQWRTFVVLYFVSLLGFAAVHGVSRWLVHVLQ